MLSPAGSQNHPIHWGDTIVACRRALLLSRPLVGRKLVGCSMQPGWRAMPPLTPLLVSQYCTCSVEWRERRATGRRARPALGPPFVSYMPVPSRRERGSGRKRCHDARTCRLLVCSVEWRERRATGRRARPPLGPPRVSYMFVPSRREDDPAENNVTVRGRVGFWLLLIPLFQFNWEWCRERWSCRRMLWWQALGGEERKEVNHVSKGEGRRSVVM